MKKTKNYLDFIPVRNNAFKWHINDEGIVVVEVVRNGLFDKIAQVVFKRPKKSEIKLDEHGSFVWKCIDDISNVHEIALKVEEYFGEDEKLYERLIIFCNILKDNKFITYKN